MRHRFDENCDELWQYYQDVIHWVQTHFTVKRKEMKGVQWGEMYRLHRDTAFSESNLRQRVQMLMMDGEVKRKSGIYWYVMDGDERHLDLRAFDQKTQSEAYTRQNGVCPICGKHFAQGEMEADHIIPWCQGGRTVEDNCQMLCKNCNRHKSGK